jgi:hypothetical protein
VCIADPECKTFLTGRGHALYVSASADHEVVF